MNFSEIRNVLLNPSESSKRKELANYAATGQAASATVKAGAIGVAIVSGIATLSGHQIIGTLGLLFSGAVTVLTHDTGIICENTKNITTNLVDRAKSSWSKKQLSDELLKNTWVAKDLAGHLVVAYLEKDK